MLDLQSQANILEKEALEELNHIDRCFSICKRNNGKCFSDVNHIRCISDMVINKSWAALITINKAKQECECEHIAFFLEKSLEELEELIRWAKRIQK